MSSKQDNIRFRIRSRTHLLVTLFAFFVFLPVGIFKFLINIQTENLNYLMSIERQKKQDLEDLKFCGKTSHSEEQFFECLGETSKKRAIEREKERKKNQPWLERVIENWVS